jgi:hypothetical protein
MTARAARSARPAADAPILGGRHTVVRPVADRHESTRETSGENVYGGHGSDDHGEDPGQWDGSGDHSQEHDGTEDGDDSTPEHESDGSGEHEDGWGESRR